jgi:hypothetical protein
MRKIIDYLREAIASPSHSPHFLLVIATVLLVIFAYKAWNEATEATKIARQQLISGAADFVFMERADLISDTAQRSPIWQFIPRWRNSGDTPATNLRIHVNYNVFPGAVTAGSYLMDYTTENILIVLGPKAVTETAWFALPPEIILNHPYIWGWARYEDTISNKHHISRFCYILTGWQGDPRVPVAESSTPVLLF